MTDQMSYMVPSETPDEKPPMQLFMLHFLSGSTREWRGVQAVLDTMPEAGVQAIAMDLPGFGDAAELTGFSVAAMADHVATGIRAARARQAVPGPWALVGHSMGAKVATVLARRAQDDEAGLEGLLGLVLLAGSPPSPEPMEESRRTEMLGWFKGSPATNDHEAAVFIASNTVSLEPKVRALVVEDVLRMNPEAWRAWLLTGSLEDWSTRIGILSVPALILSGAEDADLGPSAQQRLMAPHFANSRLETLPGVRHLLPLEAAGPVAEKIRDFLGSL